MSALVKSSLARKWVMALSGLFLVIFLTQHFVINITSVIAPDTFNEWSHFMGYNPLVQFVAQPILIGGLIVHFIMGIVLDLQNRKARPVKYAKFSGNSNSQWVSRNMIISGLVVLAFLGLHMYDFWVHEMTVKYIDVQPEDPTRYLPELKEKFVNPVRVGIYVVSFILLAMHLWHGFNSSFQSMGAKAINKGDGLRKATYAWSVLIPAGFIFIALYHFFSH
ncbi:succinate dehydrogenase / fumarate reductase cytochrome b subunit [Nonlabens dokdonensis]|uniref:Succinate dehydrogenase / fumarate reductase cytochrome b subunit n=2 Tax=Nonlabens dokdonensis TaxID=328515 RepID=A0ABX5Q363_9FLAO|nr:succinate dehydrogenase cytochrome b subunit [Nonlabens dokdonensis]AGC76663.1 putative succinate dehydrogenase/fumarate reductase, cytochrome b subunit [Nonlabens dokdonensis DSW-6]PZX44312.1 succinate dehydrogenase / fumarate reductase cytochrome b subunit [Nonlabens dokdonensis]